MAKSKKPEPIYEDVPSIKSDSMLDEVIQIDLTSSEPITEDDILGSKKVKKPRTVTGLGDYVKLMTDAMGIEQCDACKERQEKLNALFPFIKQAKAMTKDDIAFLKRIKTQHVIGSADRKTIFDLYNFVMSKKLAPCSCPGLIIQMITELWNIYLAEYSKNRLEN